MIQINLSPKSVLHILLVVVLFGFGTVWIMAGRQPLAEAQPSMIGSEEEEPERPNQSQSLFYYRISGLSFLPRYTGYEYVHTAEGCLYRADSNINPQSYGSDIRLPDGAEISSFNVYFYDLSAQNFDVDLIAYDGAGGQTVIKSSGSTAANGYGSVNSGVFLHTVNNIVESLTMIVTIPPGLDNTLQFCGIRITYEFDISSNYLPAMLNLSAP